MRLLWMLVVLLVSSAPARAQDTWSDPFPGVRRLSRVTSNQQVNALVVDLCAPGVSVRTTGTSERRRTVSSFGNLVNAQAAINGDFFSFETYSTNGPAMANGNPWGGTDHDYVAPLMFGANQAALPPHEATGGVEDWARQIVSGHPSLLVGGQPRNNNGDSLCTARHPRTAAGLDAGKTKLILAVVDGRATNRIGMTCDELRALMAELGAHDAVNLDGGGSSAMWLSTRGVVNAPSDGQERVVANHLAIRATGSGDSPHCAAAYGATFAAGNAPAEMVSGEEAVVFLEYRNDSNVTWNLDTRVGTQDPQDRDSAFFKAENWISPNRPTAADHSTYAPGDVGRFTWAMVAPEVDRSTRFEESFQLVQEGVTWFGPKQTLSIVVHPRSGPTGDPDDPSDEESSGCTAGGGAGLGVLGFVVGIGALRRRRVRHLPVIRR